MSTEFDICFCRIGRTGRVGNVGKATSFYDENVDRSLAADLVSLLNLNFLVVYYFTD